ncbi:hypothetical protein ES705_38227 [subsurface metagenome]
MMDKIKISSSRIKFEELLSLIDKAINSGRAIHIKKSLMSQSNNAIKFLRWLEKHKIISLIPIEIKIPKKISIRSRSRKIEIALQFHALELPMKEIAKKFNVKLSTAQGYLDELASITDHYFEALNLFLKLKNINLNTDLNEFPQFPIRINIKELENRLIQSEYDQFMNLLEINRYIKKVTGQKLGTIDLSILLPK